MNALHRHRSAGRGVTLVDLLVVVTILMMLAAFAIPTIRPLSKGRRVREAARAVDVFLTQAKIRALEIQRPVGILLERIEFRDDRDTPNLLDDEVVFQDDACNVLRMVEIPPPYAGDFSDSRLRIQNWTTVVLPAGGRTGHPHYNATQINYIVLKLAVKDLHMSNRLLKWGDKVQFGFQGPIFEIVNDPLDDGPSDLGADFEPDTDGYLVFTNVTTHVLTVIAPAMELGGVAWPLTDKAAGEPVDPLDLLSDTGTPVWSPDTTFQFFRQPQPSPGAPLRLPKDTVIDLADSGYFETPASSADAFSFVYTPATVPHLMGEHLGPMILFAPNGAISHVYHWDVAGQKYGSARVTTPVFLMVGKWERTGLNTDGTSLADDGLHNWQDASNLWLAIGPQNGFVTAAEVDTHYLANPTDTFLTDNVTASGVYVPPTIFDSRRYAREAQISKGALEE